jgi:hypothetical protein
MVRHPLCKKTQSSCHTIPPQLAALCSKSSMKPDRDEKFRATIYVHLFRKLIAKGNLFFQDFSYESGKQYFTGCGLITEPSDPIYLIVAVPNISDDDRWRSENVI